MSPRITDPADCAYLLALGERVKIIRRVRGMSKVVAGERAGLDRGYLGRVEDGLHNLSVVTLLHLARGLAVPLPLLVDDRATPLRILRLLGNLTEPDD